jgi:hypothetical protein
MPSKSSYHGHMTIQKVAIIKATASKSAYHGHRTIDDATII